ncbi:hypothetical protein BCR44DRAFT_50000 [Catenaria anguillulae PL171]|uniref:Disease resistance R13L4/SHOC-2-like LRR domain-containing protein n=1 Tax=Catenaria anguillulae PL171 TaxID=765915 RepID=A0A1Y2HVN3_9FUNG|nr:hypothetical protein BCR44DRAFT_50000 [Catenaria anguillulae PL171]
MSSSASEPNDCAIVAGLPWSPRAVDPPPASGCCGWRKDAIYCVLGRIYHLSLVDIPLAGPLSDDIAKLTELTRLRLHNTNTSGPLPKDLFKLPKLDEFWLMENPTTGPIPDGFNTASQLRKVFISDVLLDGSLPASLRGMSSLRELTIQNTNLGGRFPDLSDLPQLSDLIIRNNKFTEFNLDAITKLKRLTYLGISDNKFTGKLPEAIGQLTDLTGLDVSKNAFTGPIPESLTNLIKLRFLRMFDNQFDGPLPAAIGQLTALIEFNLSGNRLSGTIPSSLGDIRTLRELNLANNRFTGSLSPNLANIANLTHLNLHHNQLSGGFPPMYVFFECQVTGANRFTCHTPLPADAPKTAYLGWDPACQREIAAAKLPVCGSQEAGVTGGDSSTASGSGASSALVSPLFAAVGGAVGTLLVVAMIVGLARRRRVRERRETQESRAVELGAPYGSKAQGEAVVSWRKAFGKSTKAPSRASSAATTTVAQRVESAEVVVAGPLEPTHRPPSAGVLESGFVADPEEVWSAVQDEVAGDAKR